MVVIAQLSDTHITAGPDGTVDDCSGPVQALRAAVASVLSLPARPDGVLVTGDLTDRGRPAEYAALRGLLEPLTVPVHLLPGNHDDRSALRAAFPSIPSAGPATPADAPPPAGTPERSEAPGSGGTPGTAATSVPSQAPALAGTPVQYAVDIGGIRILCCDSTIPGAPGGAMDEARLDWIDRTLAEAPRTPTVVALHHPPFPIGIRFIDEMGFADPGPFATVIARHRQVVRVLSGHVHRGAVTCFAGTVAVTCPSTYQQLYLDLSRPGRAAVTGEPAGFAVHTIEPAGGTAVTHFMPVGDHRPIGID